MILIGQYDSPFVRRVAIAQLGRSERIDLAAVGEAVRRYKVGVTEDPW